MKNTKYSYIDLFAGCGGLSLGLFNSGFWKGLFAIEKSYDAFLTLQHNLINNNNHFDWLSWLPQKNHDINDVIKNHQDELKNLQGKVDLVAGGPPCQGFSTAGRRQEDDIRNTLIDSYVKFIRLVQPKIIFFENVKGFTQKFDKNKEKGRVYSEYVKKELQSSKKGEYQGYKVHGELINFSEYGVPQKRTRFILIGIRNNIKDSVKDDFFDLLKKSKTDFLVSKDLTMTNCLEDAISDLLYTNGQIQSLESSNFKAGIYNKPKSSYQKYIRKNNSLKYPDSHRFPNHKQETIKKFEYILKNAEKNKTLSNQIKENFGLKKRTIIPLSAKSIPPTITTLPDDYLHYSEPRIFTVREYARLQSFMDWYEFKGKYTTGGLSRTQEVPRYSQIGNAIPPLFGEQAGIVLNKMIQNV